MKIFILFYGCRFHTWSSTSMSHTHTETGVALVQPSLLNWNYCTLLIYYYYHCGVYLPAGCEIFFYFIKKCFIIRQKTQGLHWQKIPAELEYFFNNIFGTLQEETSLRSFYYSYIPTKPKPFTLSGNLNFYFLAPPPVIGSSLFQVLGMWPSHIVFYIIYSILFKYIHLYFISILIPSSNFDFT